MGFLGVRLPSIPDSYEYPAFLLSIQEEVSFTSNKATKLSDLINLARSTHSVFRRIELILRAQPEFSMREKKGLRETSPLYGVSGNFQSRDDPFLVCLNKDFCARASPNSQRSEQGRLQKTTC
jgi:hypothetical protein